MNSLLSLWVLICCRILLVKSDILIPKTLTECYTRNITESFHLPLNLHTLLDIIRKVEKHSYGSADMRVISSSILHRFKFDGIERIQGVLTEDGILPYIASGSQRTKHKLIQELVPGNADFVSWGNLTLIERCTLHFALSNTIIKYNSSHANPVCQRIRQVRKRGGHEFLKSWDYAQELGVVLTPYGTIAPGVVITAIAAVLHGQNVTIKELLKSYNISYLGTTEKYKNVNFIQHAASRFSKDTVENNMWHNSLMTSSMILNNVWFGTIAGDLAEMVIYQGPVVQSLMTLGAKGYWNNTAYNKFYYITGNETYFDATHAEILGGIDGLIIARNLYAWLNKIYTLRLSQILDIYYSSDGIGISENVKACNRQKTFLHVTSQTVLEEQVNAASHILAYHSRVAYMSTKVIKRMSEYAVNAFSTYIENQLSTKSCSTVVHQPTVETLIIFDGTWNRDYTINFFSDLINDIDVSLYGSKMGIIHGTTGEWLLNVTNSPSSAYYSISNFSNILWPVKINYLKTLQTVLHYLNVTWMHNEEKNVIGNLGQVIVFLVPQGYLPNDEQGAILTLLRQIKFFHPDVHFLYYTYKANANSLKPFILGQEDHLITSELTDIVRRLSKIPKILRAINTSRSVSNILRSQVEDYINPRQTITYRLHSKWKKHTKKTIVTVHSFAYGNMKVCAWNQFKNNGEKIGFHCKDLSGHTDISLVDYSTSTEGTLYPDTYYCIQNVTSLHKCTEIDCRLPSQVRYIIRMQQIYFKNYADEKKIALLNITLLLLIHVTL